MNKYDRYKGQMYNIEPTFIDLDERIKEKEEERDGEQANA